jgi:hypothetical protein
VASSLVIVSNLALSHLGHGTEIASLDERSKAAQACNRFIESARDEMLREFVWPFATKIVALGLVTDSEDVNHPTDEWVFSYRYPSDCLFFRKIQSGIRNDNGFSRVPYRLAADDQGTLVFTDRESAKAEYTSTLGQNPARWHADFELALSYRLAAYICPRIVDASVSETAQLVNALWRTSVLKAQANAANEEQEDPPPDSELLLARN